MKKVKRLSALFMLMFAWLIFLIYPNTANSDLKYEIANSSYMVPFGDWVVVYISATLCPVPNADYWVSVLPDFIDSKTRFIITLNFADGTKIGEDFYRKFWPGFKRQVEALCKRWAMQGYPISLNDFHFKVHPY